MHVDVRQPGMMTTVQDLGRRGCYALGIPEGGALDRESALLANALVGNTAGDAVLECTYVGPELHFPSSATVAVTGAPVDVTVNGDAVAQWTRLEVSAGDVLRFGIIKGGTRYFVAVRGGFDLPVVMGSRSTYVLGGLGGVDGRPLKAGDVLPVGAPARAVPRSAEIADRWRPDFSKAQEVRIIFGLYDHLLTDEGRRRLVEEEWVLTPVADRMGLRYKGPGVEWAAREQPFGAGQDPSNIVDAGYAVGSIQVPGGTQPIVLHRDAVSGGGYAMVATVISADMDLLARAAPGTSTRFRAVSMEEALEARRARAQRVAQAAASLEEADA